MENKIQWKDGTLKTPHLRIQITNSHRHDPGQWVMHVRELNWNTVRLGLSDIASEEVAQSTAKTMVKSHLNSMIDSLNGL